MFTAWTQFEFSWSWSCDEDLDSHINIWDLLSVPVRSREGSDGSRTEDGEEDKQERNFGWLLESQIPQDTLDHKLHLRLVPPWSKERTIKLPPKSVPSYRFSQEHSASSILLLLYTENKVGFGREGPRESEYPQGCALHVAITNLPCLHLSCKVWFSMFFWVKEFNCEAEFTASLRMHLEPVHFHRNFHSNLAWRVVVGNP